MIYGDEISIIRPIWYTRFFIFCDMISLSLQGAGGGLAASATQDSTMKLGNNLMLAGLIFQIVSLLLFATACIHFFIRVRKFKSLKNPLYRKVRSSAKFRGFLCALNVSFITIFTRCIYRAVELGGGWNNKLMREETPYIILESWYVGTRRFVIYGRLLTVWFYSMIVIAVLALILFHPGASFQGHFNTMNDKPEYSSIHITNGEERHSLAPISEPGKMSHQRYSSA